MLSFFSLLISKCLGRGERHTILLSLCPSPLDVLFDGSSFLLLFLFLCFLLVAMPLNSVCMEETSGVARWSLSKSHPRDDDILAAMSGLVFGELV